MIAFLLSAALTLAPALEDWRAVEGVTVADAKFWVDMDSIRVEGAKTHFRTRVVLPNFPGFAYVDSVADCAAKTAEMRHLELVRDGKVVKTQDFEPGSRSKTIDDDQGRVLQALICKA
jgi:hypothetical protein